jgi:hypothetical protein
MSAAGLWSFVVTLVGLAIVIGLIWAAMEFRPLPEPYRKFARLAVGGAAALMVLVAIGSVLFGGGGGISVKVTPGSIIEFAIGVIVLYAVLWICDAILDYFGVPFADSIKFILTIIALVVILALAEKALLGGGLGMINIGNFGTERRSEFGIPFHVADTGADLSAVLR